MLDELLDDELLDDELLFDELLEDEPPEDADVPPLAAAVAAGAAGVGPWPPVAATFTERKSMRESCAALWSW